MNRTHLIPLAALLSLVLLLPAGPAWSRDEENVAQVYLEFDPETGELKPAVDAAAQAANHAQAQQLQAAQDALESPVRDTPSGSATPTVLAVIGVAVLLIAALVFWRRRSASNAS